MNWLFSFVTIFFISFSSNTVFAVESTEIESQKAHIKERIVEGLNSRLNDIRDGKRVRDGVIVNVNLEANLVNVSYYVSGFSNTSSTIEFLLDSDTIDRFVNEVVLNSKSSTATLYQKSESEIHSLIPGYEKEVILIQ